MNHQIKESDWKIFKELQPRALQRCCEGVMEEVVQVIRDISKDSHKRYTKMYKIVRESDKKIAQMFDDSSRSKALLQLMMYYDDHLIDDGEFAQFSEETRERILAILEIQKEK